MSSEFTDTERELLAPFFTNVDRTVFGLRLPEEVAGALFSRYSRSTKGLRRTFLDEFLNDPELALRELVPASLRSGDDTLALKKARAFFDRVLVGYGDDSVAQLGGAHIACEAISNVAAKILEDARIGIAPLEKSTRYVRFDQRDASGEYLYYREPRIMESPYRAAYVEVLDLLFESYSAQIEPVVEFVRRALPIEETQLRHPESGDPLSYRDAQKDDRLKRWVENAYRSTVRAHACDILRGYLPAATLTNVGLYGVGQAFEHLLTKLYSQELKEARELASSMHRELGQLIPSFVKRAGFSEYLSSTWRAIRSLAERELGQVHWKPAGPVTLVDYDREAEEKVLAAILYPHAQGSLEQLRELVASMPETDRRRILEEYLQGRHHRRNKPGRALEQVYYTFDVLGNLGIYRDLQRHRILSQERQDFTTRHGYDKPPELEEAGFGSGFDRCMEKAASLYERIHRDFPLEAQYAVPFAFRVRWYMKMNLREAAHIVELRTMPQGHPDYRTIAQSMWRQIREVHPALAGCARFLDEGEYRLGRLLSEMKTEYKKSFHDGKVDEP